MSRSRLSELCGQLLSHQVPRLDPRECTDMLLKKYEDVECVLLQLSTLRWLYSHHTPFPSSPSPIPSLGETREEESGSEATGTPPAPDDGETHCYSKYTVEVLDCVSQCLPDLIQELMRHLQSGNQFISFCASKTLVCVMLRSGVQDQTITDIFSTLKSGVQSHVGVYSLQTIREFLKSLRKHLNTTGSTLDAIVLTSLHSCFQSLHHHQLWLNALNLLQTEVPSHKLQQTLGKLELTVGEFLSLTVEMLRHEQPPLKHSPNPSPPSSEASLPLHTECIIENLSRLFSLVEVHGNLFLLKRLVDIAQKSAEKAGPVRMVQCVVPVLTALLGLPLCRELLQYWMKECSIELLPVSVSRSLAQCRAIVDSSIHNELKTMEGKSPEERGLVNTAIRKLSVFCLKCIAAVVSMQPQPLLNTAIILDNLLSGLKGLLSSMFSNRGGSEDLRLFTEVLFHVVSEEDGCLIQTLQASHHIWTHIKANVGTVMSFAVQMFLPVVNPHTLWLLFLQSISYDHSVLLDLLLSPEAKFGEALHSYLELTLVDWEAFENACGKRHTPDCFPSSATGSGALHSLISDDRSEPTSDALTSKRRDLDHIKLSCSPPASKRTKIEERRSTDTLVEYSSSSDEDTASSCGLVLPGGRPQAGNDSALPSYTMSSSSLMSPSFPSCPIESLLDKVLGCLVRLRLALERLQEAKLLPEDLSASGVISSIERVEELYEGET